MCSADLCLATNRNLASRKEKLISSINGLKRSKRWKQLKVTTEQHLHFGKIKLWCRYHTLIKREAKIIYMFTLRRLFNTLADTLSTCSYSIYIYYNCIQEQTDTNSQTYLYANVLLFQCCSLSQTWVGICFLIAVYFVFGREMPKGLAWGWVVLCLWWSMLLLTV